MLLLGQMTDKAKTEKHLIVYRLDRLSRVAYEQEMLIQILGRGGCRLHSTQHSEQLVLAGGMDVSDAGRILFRQIMAAFAQYERAIIQLRLTAGLRHRASQGRYAGGRYPYGYKIVDRDLAVDTDAAVTVQRIFYMRDECNLSMSQIADTLARRYATPGWAKMRVKRVLDNRQIYQGVYTDPFGVRHDRKDLKILPENWHDWVDTTNAGPVPVFSDEED